MGYVDWLYKKFFNQITFKFSVSNNVSKMEKK